MGREQRLRGERTAPETSAEIPKIGIESLISRVEGSNFGAGSLHEAVLVGEHTAPESVLFALKLFHHLPNLLHHLGRAVLEVNADVNAVALLKKVAEQTEPALLVVF